MAPAPQTHPESLSHTLSGPGSPGSPLTAGPVPLYQGRNTGQPVHAEKLLLERVCDWELDHTQPCSINCYISWSPCDECAPMLVDFLHKHRGVELNIRAARIYSVRFYKQRLRDLRAAGANISIMTSASPQGHLGVGAQDTPLGTGRKGGGARSREMLIVCRAPEGHGAHWKRSGPSPCRRAELGGLGGAQSREGREEASRHQPLDPPLARLPPAADFEYCWYTFVQNEGHTFSPPSHLGDVSNRYAAQLEDIFKVGPPLPSPPSALPLSLRREPAAPGVQLPPLSAGGPSLPLPCPWLPPGSPSCSREPLMPPAPPPNGRTTEGDTWMERGGGSFPDLCSRHHCPLDTRSPAGPDTVIKLIN